MRLNFLFQFKHLHFLQLLHECLRWQGRYIQPLRQNLVQLVQLLFVLLFLDVGRDTRLPQAGEDLRPPQRRLVLRSEQVSQHLSHFQVIVDLTLVLRIVNQTLGLLAVVRL